MMLERSSNVKEEDRSFPLKVDFSLNNETSKCLPTQIFKEVTRHIIITTFGILFMFYRKTFPQTKLKIYSKVK